MTLEAYKNLADSNNWLLLWPEIALGITALLLLAVEWVLPRERCKQVVPAIALAAQGLLLAFVAFSLFCSDFTHLGVSFAGLIKQTQLTNLMRCFFLLSSFFVTYLALIYFKREKDTPQTEFYHLLLVVTASMMLFVQSNQFVLFFVALELVTVGFYVLVSYSRNHVSSLEAGLKYLILGALSSPMLLFGIVLVYGIAGNPNLIGHASDPLNFQQIEHFLLADPTGNPYMLLAVVLIFCGIAFKIGAVPFQIWIPDVYQGAATPVTAFLAVASKAAGFMVLINLLRGPFAPLSETLLPFISAIAAVTILFGNITALTQRNTKRLMGLSGIAHAGYLLLGVAASIKVEWAVGAVVFYLFSYLLGSFAVFGVMSLLGSEEGDAWQTLDDYENLRTTHPFLATVLTLGLGSLAGIPPLVGFVGKFLLFVAAFQAKLYGLLAVAIIGVVISIYYYFGWIRSAYFRSWDLTSEEGGSIAKQKLASIHCFVLGLVALAVIVFGVYQASLSNYLF